MGNLGSLIVSFIGMTEVECIYQSFSMNLPQPTMTEPAKSAMKINDNNTLQERAPHNEKEILAFLGKGKGSLP